MAYKNPDRHPILLTSATTQTVSGQTTLDYFDKIAAAIEMQQWLFFALVSSVDDDGVMAVGLLNGLDGGKVSAASTPSMKVNVQGGVFFVDYVPFRIMSDYTSADFVAPVSNPRIDAIVASATLGAMAIIPGVEEAVPSVPAVGTGEVLLASIYLRTGMVTIEDSDVSPFTEGYITDQRVMLNT